MAMDMDREKQSQVDVVVREMDVRWQGNWIWRALRLMDVMPMPGYLILDKVFGTIMVP
jgi:hypothetical protein